MRLKNILRNSLFSLVSQFVLIIIGFFSQRVMNLVMGESLIGMNSVIANIIAILSVSELGISSAIVYHLYEALAVRNESRIISLMNLYRRAYCLFAGVITAAGVCVMPFVHNFLKGNSFSLSYVRLIYCLWLARTALSYLLSYKRSILIADQKEYIVSITAMVMNPLNYGLIIVILKLWQNYELALGLNIVVEAAVNIWIIRYVNRKYPFLRRSRPISDAIQPSVGNMLTEKNQEKNYQILRQITFLFFVLAAFCSAGLMSLMTRFVTDIWLTESYRLDKCTVTLCVMNVYLFFISLPTAMMMTASGMFEKERDLSILYAAANLILSLLLVRPLGMAGVLLGTSVSYIAQIVCRTYFFSRYYLKKTAPNILRIFCNMVYW